MIKTLNRYSGLISVVVLIVGFAWTIRTFAFDIEKKIDYITTDYSKYKEASLANHRASDAVLLGIKSEIEKERIHQEYMVKLIENSTQATRDLSRTVNRLNILLEKIAITNGVSKLNRGNHVEENG
jgi:hypothetical protein